MDETLLAVTWTSESEFSRAPRSNGNAKDSKGVIHEEWIEIGNADVGPMQINFRTWYDWGPIKDLNNAFGLTTTGYRDFDGDYIENLRAGARILKYFNSKYDRAGAAGRYRTGEGDYHNRPAGQADFKARKERFNQLKNRYDNFFKCIKNGR